MLQLFLALTQNQVVPFSKPVTIKEVHLVVTNSVPAISYLLDIPNKDLALGDSMNLSLSVANVVDNPLPNQLTVVTSPNLYTIPAVGGLGFVGWG